MLVETARGIVAQEDQAAAHARADPATRIAEHDSASAGHVLEREAAQVAAENDLRAGETDAGACIGAALHEETSPLRAVREALAHGSVHPGARSVARLQDGDLAA